MGSSFGAATVSGVRRPWEQAESPQPAPSTAGYRPRGAALASRASVSAPSSRPKSRSAMSP